MNFDPKDHVDSDPRDYVLDISSQALPAAPTPDLPPTTPSRETLPSQRYLSIHFKCCNAFTRIYPNTEGTAYTGHCPKCARPVSIKIGPGGTSNRIFTVE